MSLLDSKVKVRRGNVIYTIDREDIQRYLDKGFDVISSEGEVIQEAEPKDPASIRLAYLRQVEIVKELREENARLKEELSASTAKPKQKEPVKEEPVEEVAEEVVEEEKPKKKTSRKKAE